MKNRLFIVHRWGGKPTDDWYLWLSQELEKRDFQVMVPEMPQTEAPVIQEWVARLAETAEETDQQMFLVGHSIGCQTIIRYLETLTGEQRVGGVLLVAPWIHLVNLEDAQSEAIAKPWTETPINWEKARRRAAKFTCLFSDNDPWVPVEEAEIFEKKLGAEVKILPNQGHFTDKKSEIIFQEMLKHA